MTFQPPLQQAASFAVAWHSASPPPDVPESERRPPSWQPLLAIHLAYSPSPPLLLCPDRQISKELRDDLLAGNRWRAPFTATALTSCELYLLHADDFQRVSHGCLLVCALLCASYHGSVRQCHPADATATPGGVRAAAVGWAVTVGAADRRPNDSAGAAGPPRCDGGA